VRCALISQSYFDEHLIDACAPIRHSDGNARAIGFRLGRTVVSNAVAKRVRGVKLSETLDSSVVPQCCTA
jgi:hypothetical protein